jgi:hypothetical protein
MTAKVHDFPTKHARPYIVTLCEGRKFRRVVRMANCWSDCWMSVLNEFGKAVVSGVRPAK